jgi:hypothetical protein
VFLVITGELLRAPGVFFDLGEVFLEPIRLIDRNLLSRGLRALAKLGAGREIRKIFFG